MHGLSFADLMCVNHAVYEGDDRMTMTIGVDGSQFLLPNMPFHNNAGIAYIIFSIECAPAVLFLPLINTSPVLILVLKVVKL